MDAGSSHPWHQLLKSDVKFPIVTDKYYITELSTGDKSWMLPNGKRVDDINGYFNKIETTFPGLKKCVFLVVDGEVQLFSDTWSFKTIDKHCEGRFLLGKLQK